MAARKPNPKIAPKPAPKPAPLQFGRPRTVAPPAPPENLQFGRPRTVAPPLPQSPIDIVRDPRFGSAMANQNYANLMRDLQARLAAGRGGVGAVIDRLPAVFGRLPAVIDRPPTLAGSILNPETLKKARDEYVKQNPGEVNRRVTADMTGSRYLGPIGRSMSGFDKWFETNYINNPNSPLSAQERMTLDPRMGSARPTQEEIDRKYVDDGRGGRVLNAAEAARVKSQFDALRANNYTQGRLTGAPVNQNQYIDPQSPQGQAMEKIRQTRQMARDALSRYNPNVPSLMPIRMPGSVLYQDLANQQMQGYQNSLQQSQQGTFGSQYQNLANQQMQNYQNLLQQGIQRSNTMNQDAASNFANMQAGAPTTQPASPAKANPVVPIAGMGMQQPKATPAPRKFSTVNTPSARFG